MFGNNVNDLNVAGSAPPKTEDEPVIIDRNGFEIPASALNQFENKYRNFFETLSENKLLGIGLVILAFLGAKSLIK